VAINDLPGVAILAALLNESIQQKQTVIVMFHNNNEGI